MVTDTQKVLVQESFAAVAPIADEAAVLFYRRLFELDPSLERMFRGDMAEQRRKIWKALTVFIRSNGGHVYRAQKIYALSYHNSTLAARLLELGYSVRAAGITTRITGSTENHGFMPVDVIEITL